MDIDGQQYPSKPYAPDFEKGLCMREMIGLYEALDMLEGESNMKITRTTYHFGKTIFGFNFSPDLTSGSGSVGYVSPVKFGAVRIMLKFKKALERNITLLVYFEFDKIVEIDIKRNAEIDLF